MSRKVAVYAGTKNIYDNMYVALKSLLINTKMDMVYLLIEDNKFPYPLPDNVSTINVKEQEFFSPGSPNFANQWGYMAMMKVALSLFLPEDKVLWLDCDTIVTEDISDLFEMDLTGFYYAGVAEPQKCKDVFRYINVGVTMCNLKLLNDTQKDLELIAFLNKYKLNWADQEVVNILCQGRIRLIDSSYNANNYTIPCLRPKIIHYAAVSDFMNDWAYQMYEAAAMPGIGGEDNADNKGKSEAEDNS